MSRVRLTRFSKCLLSLCLMATTIYHTPYAIVAQDGEIDPSVTNVETNSEIADESVQQQVVSENPISDESVMDTLPTNNEQNNVTDSSSDVLVESESVASEQQGNLDATNSVDNVVNELNFVNAEKPVSTDDKQGINNSILPTEELGLNDTSVVHDSSLNSSENGEFTENLEKGTYTLIYKLESNPDVELYREEVSENNVSQFDFTDYSTDKGYWVEDGVDKTYTSEEIRVLPITCNATFIWHENKVVDTTLYGISVNLYEDKNDGPVFIKNEAVNNLTWDEIVSKYALNEIDLLSSIFGTTFVKEECTYEISWKPALPDEKINTNNADGNNQYHQLDVHISTPANVVDTSVNDDKIGDLNAMPQPMMVKTNQVQTKVFVYGLRPGKNFQESKGNPKNWFGLQVLSDVILPNPETVTQSELENAMANLIANTNFIYPTLEHDGVRYNYDPNGGVGTYSVNWMELTVANGANAMIPCISGSDTAGYGYGVKTYHLDGIVILNQDKNCTVTFKVKFPESSKEEIVEAKEVAKGTTNVQTPSNQLVSPRIERNGKVYIFDGWYNDSNCTEKANFDTAIDKNTEYYGKYNEVPTYKVSYKWNNLPENYWPNLPVDNNVYIAGDTFNIDTTYTEESVIKTYDNYGNINGEYRFQGWNSKGSIVINSDITINGDWEYKSIEVTPFDYVVNYHYDDVINSVSGSGVKESIIPYSKDKTVIYNNQSYILENVIAKNNGIITENNNNNVVDVYYTLDMVGAIDPNNGNDSGDNIPDKNQVRVNFEIRNGSLAFTHTYVELNEKDSTSPDKKYGKLLPEQIPNVKEAAKGYLTNGVWSLKDGKDIENLSTYPINQPTTFVLTLVKDDTQWRTVTFENSNENCGKLEGTLRYEVLVNTQWEAIKVPSISKNEGYVFDAWFVNDKRIDAFPMTITENSTYIAYWEKDENGNSIADNKELVTVIYTDGVENEEVFADVSYTATPGSETPQFGKATGESSVPQRNGYVFMGWSPTFNPMLPQISELTGNKEVHTIIYTATWEKDIVGNIDSITGQHIGDGIADIYQTKVSFKAVNGEVKIAINDKVSVNEVYVTLYDSQNKPAVDGLGHLSQNILDSIQLTANVGFDIEKYDWNINPYDNREIDHSGREFTVTFMKQVFTVNVNYRNDLDETLHESDQFTVEYGTNLELKAPYLAGYALLSESKEVVELKNITENRVVNFVYGSDSKGGSLTDPENPDRPVDPDITADGIADKYQVRVDYNAINGNVSVDYFYVTLTKDGKPCTAKDGGTYTLSMNDLPSVSANAGYHNGKWDIEPKEGMIIDENITFTVTFELIPVRADDEDKKPVFQCPQGTQWNDNSGMCEPVYEPVISNNPQINQGQNVTVNHIIHHDVTIEDQEMNNNDVNNNKNINETEQFVDKGEIIEIVDEKTPQALGLTKGHWALLNLLATLGSVLTAIILMFAKHQKDSDDDYDDAYDEGIKTRSRKWKLITTIIAIASLVIFFLTQKMNQAMVLMDKYTLLMVALFLLNVFGLFMGRRWHEDSDEENQNA